MHSVNIGSCNVIYSVAQAIEETVAVAVAVAVAADWGVCIYCIRPIRVNATSFHNAVSCHIVSLLVPDTGVEWCNDTAIQWCSNVVMWECNNVVMW